jgi:lysophospholipase L1-like esterase
VSEYSDDAYGTVTEKSGGGTFIQTSPAARAIFETTADAIMVESYNDIYGTYPGFADIGIRADGVDIGALEPGAAGTKYNSANLGSPGVLKTVEVINGLQSKPTTDRIGAYATAVTFSAPATQVFPTPTPRLLIYGDSVAVGANATNPSLQGWAQLVRNAYSGSMLLEAWGFRALHDDAVDGAARQALADHIAAQAPALIWLAIGTNDYGLNKWTAAAFGTAYADLLDKLHTALPASVIYTQTPIPRGTETANSVGSTLGNYRTQIETAQAARAAYCTLVDGTDILTTGDLADGVHPTTAGHVLYAAYAETVLGL